MPHPNQAVARAQNNAGPVSTNGDNTNTTNSGGHTNITSQPNLAIVAEQNNTELILASSVAGDANSTNGKEEISITSFKEATTDKLNKLEERFGNFIQLFDEHSHKMDQAVKDISTNLVKIQNQSNLNYRKLEYLEYLE